MQVRPRIALPRAASAAAMALASFAQAPPDTAECCYDGVGRHFTVGVKAWL